MLLHEDRELFKQMIAEVSEKRQIKKSIVEKDYYVFMVLKSITTRLNAGEDIGVVFKGGTSLSKAYSVIERFSEDIDLCLPSERIKSKGFRKRLVKAIEDAFDTFGMQLIPGREIQSEGDYNDIRGKYESICYEVDSVEPYVKVETAHRIKEYPVEVRIISSYISEHVKKVLGSEAVVEYGLEPFEVPTIKPLRTFVDKLFAVADYYMQGKVKRYSRHIYDLYKLIGAMDWKSDKQVIEFNDLRVKVREEREGKRSCPSAKPDVILKDKIYEALSTDFYKDDYEALTRNILYENVEYEDCKNRILWFIMNHM